MNFAEKLNAGSFSQDISPLLALDIQWDFEKAAVDVFEKIIPLIPGKQSIINKVFAEHKCNTSLP